MTYKNNSAEKKALIKAENATYKAKFSLIQHPMAAYVIMLVCILADGVTLFTSYDSILIEDEMLLLPITIISAVVLNATPIILSVSMNNSNVSKKRRKITSALLAAALLTAFTVCFLIRWNSIEYMFSDNSSITETMKSLGMQAATAEADPDGAQKSVTLMLGILPMLTSVLSFSIGFSVIPEIRELHKLEIEIIKLEADIDSLKAAITELEADIEYDMDAYDERQYKAVVNRIVQMGEVIKNDARRVLACTDPSPETVSYVLEGGYLAEEQASVPVTQMTAKTKYNTPNDELVS